MGTVTKSEADGPHPSTHYLVAPDPQHPTTWGLRVKDAQGKYDQDLCGAAYAALTSNHRGQPYQGPDKGKALSRLRAIYKSQGWDWPADAEGKGSGDQTAKGEMSASSASSSTSALFTREEDGELVRYRGVKVFEAGDYPDKGIALVPEDIEEMVRTFAPVRNNLEHPPEQLRRTGLFQALDGEFGWLERVWPHPDDPWVMCGDVTVPAWLDRKAPVKGVSIEIPLEGERRISGNAITTDPRVSDAVLMSTIVQFAGSRHSKSDQGDMQKMHDILVGQGVQCDPANCPDPTSSAASAASASTKMSQQQQAKGQPNKTQNNKEKSKMSFKDKMIEFITRIPEDSMSMSLSDAGEGNRDSGDETPETTAPTTPATAASTGTADFSATAAQFSALQEQVKQLKADNLNSQASAFAAALIYEGRIAPEGRETAMQEYRTAAEDDEALPRKVAFSTSEGKSAEGTRLDALRARYASAPAHFASLTTEQMPSGYEVVLPSNPDKTKMSAEEKVARVLELTDLGRSAKAAQNGKG